MSNSDVSAYFEHKIRTAKTLATIALFLFFFYVVALILSVIALIMISGIEPADEEAYRLKAKAKNRAWLAILLWPTLVLLIAFVWLIVSAHQNG